MSALPPIVDLKRRRVIHHMHQDDRRILTTIAGDGVIELAPPGMNFAVADLFAA